MISILQTLTLQIHEHRRYFCLLQFPHSVSLSFHYTDLSLPGKFIPRHILNLL